MMTIDSAILTILIFFPLVGVVLLSILPKDRPGTLKALALGIGVVEFVLSLHLWVHFNNTGVTDQFFFSAPWIAAWNVNYIVGIDGMSLLLILLSTFLVPLALLGTWNSIKDNLKLYLICVFALETGMIGVFCALDLFLFYVFWEVMLVPMYFIIGVWGGENRVYAAVKFFIYTLFGSLLMLVALLYLYKECGRSFNLLELANYRLPFTPQKWVFVAFALAFAIKIPLFPFHTWLPDAHVQAPTAGSVILAAVLLKMGAYGFVRIALPLFPDAARYLQPWLMGLAAVGVVYGALVALVQPDIKKLIAYSSVSHMGVVMLGIFSLNVTGMSGGLYQIFSHGISTGALFLLVGMVYDRTHTRKITDYSGLAKFMPVFSVIFLIVTFSSIGAPGTNGFVGEFLSLTGAFQASQVLGVIGATGVVLGAVYMLWLVERVFFGEPRHTHGASDINVREIAVMIPLIILIFWMGTYAKPFLDKISSVAETTVLKLDDEREMVGAMLP